MIVWNKGKIGMGYRTRRKSEYLIVFQKSPVKVKGCWTYHAIPDVWEEKTPKTHSHSKPGELQRRLIAATSKKKMLFLILQVKAFRCLKPANFLIEIFSMTKIINSKP